MICLQCGAELESGVSFCTNCGAPVPDTADPFDFTAVTDPAVDDAAGGLGASLESAVQANQNVVNQVEANGQLADEAAARWAEAEAQAASDAAAAAQAPFGQSADAPEAPQGYVPPSYDSAGAGAAAAAAAGAAAAPFYQQDVSPNAHYSSQRTYEQNPYGQNTTQASYQQPSYDQNAGQSSYQQPSYGQGETVQAQQVWSEQTATNRAFAMTLYAGGLLSLIFGLCVRDKDNEFITHHLNNCAVITIGLVIASFLSFILIGGILGIYLFVMWIMGIVSAYHGDMNELPLIGKIHIVK